MEKGSINHLPIGFFNFEPYFEFQREITQRAFQLLSRLYGVDEFAEVKKKCRPTSIVHLSREEQSQISTERVIFTVTPFTIVDRDGSSFRDETMNNIIVDHHGKLLKLLFSYTNHASVPPGNQSIEALEYTQGGLGVVARRFNGYL